MFPHEMVPDGNVFAPHHYYYFLLAALLLVFAVWDNYKCREPLLSASLIGAGLFGFMFVWPRWHVAGAALALAGPTLAAVTIISGWAGLPLGGVWDDYPLKYRIGVLLGIAFAMDDALDHAFPFTTPLDWAWNAGLNQYAPYVVGIALVAVMVLGAAGYFTAGKPPVNPNILQSQHVGMKLKKKRVVLKMFLLFPSGPIAMWAFQRMGMGQTFQGMVGLVISVALVGAYVLIQEYDIPYEDEILSAFASSLANKDSEDVEEAAKEFSKDAGDQLDEFSDGTK